MASESVVEYSDSDSDACSDPDAGLVPESGSDPDSANFYNPDSTYRSLGLNREYWIAEDLLVHHLNVNKGEDVIEIVKSFSNSEQFLKDRRSISVLFIYGYFSSVALSDPIENIEYLVKIVELRGVFEYGAIVENLTVLISDKGKTTRGTTIGPLLASESMKLIVGSYIKRPRRQPSMGAVSKH